MIEPPIGFPQVVVQLDHRPARADQYRHVLVEPDHIVERHFGRFSFAVAGLQQQLISRAHAGQWNQQIKVAHRPQRGFGIGVCSQPSPFEGDRRVSGVFQQAPAIGQRRAVAHGLQRCRAVSASPSLPDHHGDCPITAALGVQQGLQTVQRRQLIKPLPVGTVQPAKGTELARTDQLEQPPPQRGQVHPCAPVSWCAWARRRSR